MHRRARRPRRAPAARRARAAQRERPVHGCPEEAQSRREKAEEGACPHGDKGVVIMNGDGLLSLLVGEIAAVTVTAVLVMSESSWFNRVADMLTLMEAPIFQMIFC